MNVKPFFDTNVLVYALAEGDPRARVSRELLIKGGLLSVHVLNEFVAVSRRKLKCHGRRLFRH
jgi:predicted nucleic acid-binding protein